MVRERFFGPHGDAGLAARAQALGSRLRGAAAGQAGAAQRAAAGAALAELVQSARVEAFPALAAAAERTAAQAGPLPPQAPAPTAAAGPVDREVPASFNTPQNVQDQAKLLETEAGATDDQIAMTAIAFTVVNRMIRNRVTRVSDVWGQYKHFKVAKQPALDVAAAVLSRRAVNPIGGATHFYTPQSNVPDPSFATQFRRVLNRNGESSSYRFYQAPGDGHVR